MLHGVEITVIANFNTVMSASLEFPWTLIESGGREIDTMVALATESGVPLLARTFELNKWLRQNAQRKDNHTKPKNSGNERFVRTAA